MSQRGFTVLELTVSAALLAVIMGTVALSISGDTATHRALTRPVLPLMRGHRVIERIGAELRMASEWGEDRDRDGVMDALEDTNDNGTLDADWNLPDGTAQGTLSFNRRIDLRDGAGNVISTGLHSRRITYRKVGGEVIREWQVTTAGGAVQTKRAVMARGVTAVTFSRNGAIITVAIEVALSKEATHTFTTRTRLRN